MVVRLIPDALVLAVEWAKNDEDLIELLEGRVSTRLPANPTLPWLRVRRVGGSRDVSEAPLDYPLLQWDVYSLKDWSEASLIIRTLQAKAEAFSGELTTGYVYGFSTVSGPEPIEEPDLDWPRFRLDTRMTTREVPVDEE